MHILVCHEERKYMFLLFIDKGVNIDKKNPSESVKCTSFHLLDTMLKDAVLQYQRFPKTV